MATPAKGTKALPEKVKKFDASSVSYNSRMQLVKRILVNMKSQKASVSSAGVLLAGDPGVGKTSFIRFLSKLFGMNLVVLEVPHITEEHIINIPYIRYNPVTNQVKKDAIEGEQKSDFDLVLAESNLYTVLKNTKPIPDKLYLKAMYSSDATMTNIRRVYEELGGTETEIPSHIQNMRETFSTILFLDEYFRRTSVSIRNMLRGILNKQLGLSKLPKHVYPIYASNIEDDGVEEIPSNNQFNVIEMKAPDKDAWFGYVVDNAAAQGIKLKPSVVDAMYEVIEQEHLSYEDKDADVRISPRRWEQIVLYIDSSLPVKNKKTAQALLTNIKENFTNHKTGAVSRLSRPLMEKVAQLISETSEIEVGAGEVLPTHRWRDTLHHQLFRKIRLGDARKYIPVISGPPGIGKTSTVQDVTDSLKLGYIYIDCSTLSYEDVMGTPLSSKDKLGNTSTMFSDSKLYKLIYQKAEENPPEEESKHGYRYLIFFDELNRTNVKTFNGLRKLILEKEFDNGKKLPPGSIVVAAINPEDSGGGVTELTKHMIDVLDIITASPNWPSVVDWMERKSDELELEYEELAEGVMEVIKAFADRFKDVNSKEVEPHFALNVGAEDSLYISPREYTQIYSEGSIALDMELQDALDDFGMKGLDPKSKNLPEIDQRLRSRIFESFEGVLKGIFIKSSFTSPIFLQTLKAWFLADPDASPIKSMVSFKGTTSKLSLMLEEIKSDTSTPLAKNIEIVSFLKNAEMDEFKAELFEFFDKVINAGGTKAIAEQKYPFRTYDGKSIKTSKDKASIFVYIIKELSIAINANNLSDDLSEILSDMTVSYLCERVAASNMDEHVETVINEASDKLLE